MCRIVGGIDFGQKIITDDLLMSMRDSLAFGGPDSAGTYIDDNIHLAQRRLSIIDLSDSGHQPMISGPWVITYNGEIYNYKEIRQRLVEFGYSFESTSDTEVIIKSFDKWGKDAVHQFRGMFAFALWNTQEKKLLLCRDRLGVKPLFWYFKDNLFLFASEIKAFHEYPFFDKTLDLEGLPHYLSKGYFHDSTCIFKYVRKVAPGSFLEISQDKEIKTSQYWDIESVYANAVQDKRSTQEITNELESILSDSFALRMVADVEVGIFLSGGIDSSLVAALTQTISSKPLHTFTIGFNNRKYNEAEIALNIASILGTKHSELYCTENDFVSLIPDLPFIFDEPFGDSSAIPTYLVSKLARSSVKVALSGDGGDELFGGYSKYKFSAKASSMFNIPLPFRQLISKISYQVSPSFVDYVFGLTGSKAYSQVGNKFLKFRQTLLSENIDDLFDKASSYLSDIELNKILKFRNNYKAEIVKCNSESIISYFGMKDIKSYLPGDILTKVDRASMHVALESREPFLDPEIINFAFNIPDSLKINSNGESKFILKNILKKYIPEQLINRPKQGFSIPIDDWLKGFLKEELLEISGDTLFFDTFNINQLYFVDIINSFFQNKYKHNPHFIWFVYCLYKWYKKWI